jgi:nucleoside-diphosphate-sugar epimerase
MGKRRRLPYTFVDNCAEALCLAGIRGEIMGQAVNVVDDQLPTISEVLRAYAACGRPIRTLGIPQWAILPLSGVYERYSRWSRGQLPEVITRYKSNSLWKPLRYSNGKAKALLDWRPRVPMDEALKRSITEQDAP